MRLLILAPFLAIAVFGASSIMPAAAAPDNKNTTSFDVSCAEPLGDVTTVSTIGNSSADVVFTTDGDVLVAKHISATSTDTLTVEGGPTIPLGESSFEGGAKGGGFQDRLISCDFTIESQNTFRLSKRAVAFFELGDEFIGATATISSTLTGTAEVIAPGN